MSSPDRGSSHRSVALLGSLSVVIEYLALRDGPRRFRPGFTCPTLLGYRIGLLQLSPTGLSPALVPLSSGLRLAIAVPYLRPHDPGWCPTRFRLVPVRSPLLRESRLISFPAGTEMFQFPASPTGIPGSTLFGQLPRTYRSQHARHLMTPRHPPRALKDLTTPTRSRPRPPPKGHPGAISRRSTSPSPHTHLPARRTSRGPPVAGRTRVDRLAAGARPFRNGPAPTLSRESSNDPRTTRVARIQRVHVRG